MNTENFCLPPRYKIGEVIGNGAYGSVIYAYDSKNNVNVAIKKLKPITDIVD